MSCCARQLLVLLLIRGESAGGRLLFVMDEREKYLHRRRSQIYTSFLKFPALRGAIGVKIKRDTTTCTKRKGFLRTT